MPTSGVGSDRERRSRYGILDWDKLRVFHAVAEAGSFTHAGEELSLSQSAVSRQVSALEEELQVPLFHRHARGLALTEQGQLLYRTAHDVFAKLALTQAMLQDSKTKPSGELRISTTVAFGSTWLAPRVREFLDLYPDMQVSLACDDREVSLSIGEADVAIRMTPPHQSDLVQRRLFTVHIHVYASPEYIERRGAPSSVEDLDRHSMVIYGAEAPPSLRGVNWLTTIGINGESPRRPLLQVNNIYGVLQAVESGLGIAALPDYVTRGNRKVVRVLPQVDGPSMDAYFVYPPELRNSKRLIVFRDFLTRKVQEWTF